MGITLLETGEDHTSPNNIAILYNKLRGDSYTFQRFYRESVNVLKNELTDLRPLNGRYLPTVDVFVDTFDRSDVPATSQGAIDESIVRILNILKVPKIEVETLREATATLQTLAQNHTKEFVASGAANKELVMNLTSVFRNHHNDFEVAFNVSRTFNAL